MSARCCRPRAHSRRAGRHYRGRGSRTWNTDAERELIFEPFYRLHPRERGASLGLNVVREIITRRQGHVAVVEDIGGGACFRITIPLVKPA
ncbi:ATP-binding protein [Phyllobacterium sp. P30BS-XVII]|uniref:ATP-binding protein n=1 Tax=Phyllobacterium sp. P30BS-XVII TaxID=2587046 RepID=UPI0032B13DBC